MQRGNHVSDDRQQGLAHRLPVPSFLVLFPLTFGTSMITPKDTLPGWLRAWLEVNPVNHAMEASRALMLGGPAAASVVWTLVSGLVFLAIFAPLAVAAYRRRA